MNKPINDSLEFQAQLRAAIKDKSIWVQEDRACIITRSPAYYGHEGSVIIEWEGSPPRFPIYYQNGCIPIVKGKKIKWQQMDLANSIIKRFLDAHPANKDESPVWVGIRWRDRP
jgi:hypothetical protein